MGGHKISDIAKALSAPFVGDGNLLVQGASEPADAGSEHLAVAMIPKFGDDIGKGHAHAAILWEGAEWQSFGLKAAIFVAKPRMAMAALTQHLRGINLEPLGIHATAVIDPSASIGANCSIGPFAVIGAETHIAASARIGAHATIGNGVRIGDSSVINTGARIGDNVVIGAGFFAHSGVVIGADGFSFVIEDFSPAEAARENPSNTGTAKIDKKWHKIQSLGGVLIGDDVEIGANSSVDAGTIRATEIGSGTKIDALVQVGHNVRVGRNCLLCAHVAIGGSAVLGNGVVLGGQAGVADNVEIGDGVIAGGASKILSNVPAGRAVLGYPAVKMDKHIESYKALYRLPRLMRDIAKSKKAVPKDGDSD